MGVLKHAVPQVWRDKALVAANAILPPGVLRQNAANLETVAGLGLVALGSRQRGKMGLVMRVIGQALDDIDGDTARALGVASRFGALLDPVCDKLKMAFEVKTLWKQSEDLPYAERIRRQSALGFIASKHAANAVLNSAAFVKGYNPQASLLGKINLWVDGVALASFGVADVCEQASRQRFFTRAGYSAALIGVPIGIAATTEYGLKLTHRPPIPPAAVDLNTTAR